MRSFIELARYAKVHPRLGPPIRNQGGYFELGKLRIIASWSEGWDHVSVSLPDRCPTWDEMERVKRAFFKDDECAMQLHVPCADYINCHPYCLHLWRPHKSTIPMPPKNMVA
jgi:hypothetical protein